MSSGTAASSASAMVASKMERFVAHVDTVEGERLVVEVHAEDEISCHDRHVEREGLDSRENGRRGVGGGVHAWDRVRPVDHCIRSW